MSLSSSFLHLFSFSHLYFDRQPVIVILHEYILNILLDKCYICSIIRSRLRKQWFISWGFSIKEGGTSLIKLFCIMIQFRLSGIYLTRFHCSVRSLAAWATLYKSWTVLGTTYRARRSSSCHQSGLIFTIVHMWNPKRRLAILLVPLQIPAGQRHYLGLGAVSPGSLWLPHFGHRPDRWQPGHVGPATR